ncbi:hypothetical protein IW261DRAFT_1420308 [Armillaria novae-zelandiae]|uniref:Uncharacterized protein n=1 Tax=Armillaria novae-zelandiae TaxID=153914 RepID=A0AA39U786_9AGAR|nr:hypothetical protein IW261DRAFT_1420308 [Armillaria novae-zelandiae]
MFFVSGKLKARGEQQTSSIGRSFRFGDGSCGRNETCRLTYSLVDLHSTIFYFILLEFLGRPGLVGQAAFVMEQQGFGSRPWSCTVFQDMEQTMDNNYCIDMMYRRLASKGMVLSKRQGVLLNFRPSMTQDVQHVFSGNDFCLDMMYRHPPWSRSPPQRLLPRHDVLTSGKRGQGINKTYVQHWCRVHPRCFKISNAPFLTPAFASAQCIDVQRAGIVRLVPLSMGLGRPAGRTSTSGEARGWENRVWSTKMCRHQIPMTAPKMNQEKYGIACKDNETRDQLKKGVDHPMWLPTPTPFEEDSGLGNRMGCLTRWVTVFLCEQIVEISREVADLGLQLTISDRVSLHFCVGCTLMGTLIIQSNSELQNTALKHMSTVSNAQDEYNIQQTLSLEDLIWVWIIALLGIRVELSTENLLPYMEGAITALQYKELLSSPQWEDWKFIPLYKNRFAFLGNGESSVIFELNASAKYLKQEPGVC